MALFGLDDPDRQQAVLFALLLLGGAYLFWQYVYTPVHEEKVVLEDRLATLQAHNDEARALTQPGRVRELRQREAEFQVALAAYETMLPSEAEVSALLEEVARAALQEDVEVVNFAPLEAVEGGNLVALPYDVQVQGEYHDVGRFLADVANLPRLVRPVVVSLEQVEIQREEGDEDEEQARVEYEVLATLTLTTYMPPDGVVRGAVPRSIEGEETSAVDPSVPSNAMAEDVRDAG